MNTKRMRGSEQNIPSILDGKFFKIIVLHDDGSVEAECVTCSPSTCRRAAL